MRKGVPGQGNHGAPAGPGVDGEAHALLAEQIRIRHIKKALACAAEGLFRARCEAELASSLARALHLERMVRAAANVARQTSGHSEVTQLDGCLLSAMELARANGDTSAAEAVAQECLALVEMHCRTVLDVQPPGIAAGPLEQASFSNGAFES